MKIVSGKAFWKQLKKALSRLLLFFLCNLLAFVVGAGIMLAANLFAGMIGLSVLESRFVSDLFFAISVTVGFILPFYFKFFVDNKEYKRFYFQKTDEGYSIRDLMKAHCAEYTKYEILLFLAISVIPVVVPEAVLGRTGISFLYTSGAFFVFTIPECFLTGMPILFAKLIGVAGWWIYIALAYVICLRLAYRQWKKGRLRERNTQQGGNTI